MKTGILRLLALFAMITAVGPKLEAQSFLDRAKAAVVGWFGEKKRPN